MELGQVLEQSSRFSKSLLWDYNRRYYEGAGANAWHTGQLPSNSTCNPYIAQAYAHTVIAYWKDAERAGQIDRAQVLYVVELAAGVGRFAFQFVTILRELVEQSSLKGIRIRYLMTDFARSNIEAWVRHPRLAALVADGVLDFGSFDVDSDVRIDLANGGVITGFNNPVVVLANYAFDSFRQDLVRIEKGELLDRRVTVRMPPPEESKATPENVAMAELRLGWDLAALQDGHWEDPVIARIAEGYRQRLDDVTVLVPTGGLRALRWFRELSKGRMLLVSSDKGFTREDELYTPEPDGLQFHAGAFSMMVNFHAIGQWFIEQGGHYAATARHSLRLKTAACVLGGTREQFADTLGVIHDKLLTFGPGECFELIEADRQIGGRSELDHILGLLRLSHHDPGLVWQFARRLRVLAGEADEVEQRDLRTALHHAWRYFFPGPQNLPLEIGRILRAVRRPIEALRYLQIAQEWYGAQAAVALEIGLCHYEAEDPERALVAFTRAIELDATLSTAKQWTTRILAERDQAR